MNRQRSRGFALIAAIAILVVLAALGAFIVSVTGLRDQGQALDILGSRALSAARAGIEWNMHKIHVLETASPTSFYSCPAATNMTFGGALSAITVTVSCSMVAPTENGDTVRVYQITSTACSVPDGTGACPNPSSDSPSYVERQVVAST
jgi:MSHA biogenesis protein MshP